MRLTTRCLLLLMRSRKWSKPLLLLLWLQRSVTDSNIVLIVSLFQAPVVRKVFFEIVDSSAGEKAENPKVAPTLAAIPEAISADPVFQVLPFLTTVPLFLSWHWTPFIDLQNKGSKPVLCRRSLEMPPLTSSRREVSGLMTQGKAKFTRTSTTTPTATGITSAGATRPLP